MCVKVTNSSGIDWFFVVVDPRNNMTSDIGVI